jgi:two-component system, response regulator
MKQEKSCDILLVEDNPNDLELTMLALEKHQLLHSIKTVRNGKEALDFIFCREAYETKEIHDMPKLILLDLKLPKVNGHEVIEQIKKDKITRNIPIVILTTSREEKDIKECYKMGVNSYIVKPIDYEEFGKTIIEVGNYWLNINEIPY